MEQDPSNEFSQVYNVEELTEGTVEGIKDVASKYGVTAVYSDGMLRLSGEEQDIGLVMNGTVPVYDESMSQRNQYTRLKTVLTEGEPFEDEARNHLGSEEDFRAIKERLRGSEKKVAMTDGGEEKNRDRHTVPEKYVAEGEEPPESTI